MPAPKPTVSIKPRLSVVRAPPLDSYDVLIGEILEALEKFDKVKRPIEDYVVALQKAQARINDWINMSLRAAQE